MELVTTEDKLKTVAERWKEQYCINGEWKEYRQHSQEPRETTYNKLVKCKNLTVEKVKKIIGNDTWTTQWCDECDEKSHKDHIQFGEDAALCVDCVSKAYGLIK